MPPKKYKTPSNAGQVKQKGASSKQQPSTQNDQLLYKIKYTNAGKQSLPPQKTKKQDASDFQQQSILVQKPKRVLKFGGENCQLEPRVVMMILEYDMSNFRKFLRLSPNWHHLVLEGIEDRMKMVEIEFVNLYYEHLFFKRSYTNSSIMYFGGKRGIRVDRILVCEVMD